MGSLTWNGGSGDWSTASNWTPLSGTDLTPAAGDDVAIDAPGTYVVTASGTQSVHNLTLDDAGATLAVSGTLAIGGAIVGKAGALDLTHGGLTIAASSTLDNLAISYVSPLSVFATPFTLTGGSTLTLGPSALMTSSANVTPVATLTKGDGVLVNEGTINTPSFPTALGVGTDLDNEGHLNFAYAFSVNGNLTNDGTIACAAILFPDAITISGNLSGSGTILLPALGLVPGASVVVHGSIGPQHIVGPVNGVFLLTARSIDSSALIDNFFAGSKIGLTGLPYSSSLQASFNGSTNGTLSIGNGSTTEASLQFAGIPNGFAFNLAADGGAGGTLITDGPPVPCFVTGTRIRTDRGEVAVEELRVGDCVPVVRAGGSLPIIWIGHRHVRPGRYPRPWELYPVRVATGAFADFVPLRDLWLSPEHCAFLHGVLVPVGILGPRPNSFIAKSTGC
jgi:hypothetical protein